MKGTHHQEHFSGGRCYSSCRGICYGVNGLAAPGQFPVEVGGARGDGAPSPATRPGAQGKGVVFCDVHRTKKNGEGFKITFTDDGLTFRYVDGFEDLPVEAGDRVFVDTIPIQHTDGVIELMRKGVEVFYLRRLTLVRKRREELKLPKTTRGDIKVLMSIEGKWFRRVTEDFLIMRRMIAAYRTLLKTHQQLLNKYKAVSDAERYAIKPAIKAVEEQMDEVAERISHEAGKRYPAYNKIVEELGIDGNTTAMEALAELVPYLGYPKGFVKLCNLLGLFKPARRRKKIYSGHLRRALQRLTCSVHGIRSFQLTARLEKQTLYKIWKTRGRPAIPAQG